MIRAIFGPDAVDMFGVLRRQISTWGRHLLAMWQVSPNQNLQDIMSLYTWRLAHSRYPVFTDDNKDIINGYLALPDPFGCQGAKVKTLTILIFKAIARQPIYISETARSDIPASFSKPNSWQSSLMSLV